MSFGRTSTAHSLVRVVVRRPDMPSRDQIRSAEQQAESGVDCENAIDCVALPPTGVHQ